MQTRFKKGAKIFDIAITAVAGMFSVGVMLYGVGHFGLIDMLIASLYNYDIYIEPFNEYTNYMLTEIWIRPTISYGLVACFVTEKQ